MFVGQAANLPRSRFFGRLATCPTAFYGLRQPGIDYTLPDLRPIAEHSPRNEQTLLDARARGSADRESLIWRLVARGAGIHVTGGNNSRTAGVAAQRRWEQAARVSREIARCTRAARPIFRHTGIGGGWGGASGWIRTRGIWRGGGSSRTIDRTSGWRIAVRGGRIAVRAGRIRIAACRQAACGTSPSRATCVGDRTGLRSRGNLPSRGRTIGRSRPSGTRTIIVAITVIASSGRSRPHRITARIGQTGGHGARVTTGGRGIATWSRGARAITRRRGARAVSRCCGPGTIARRRGARAVTRCCGARTITWRCGARTVAGRCGPRAVTGCCRPRTIVLRRGARTVTRRRCARTITGCCTRAGHRATIAITGRSAAWESRRSRCR